MNARTDQLGNSYTCSHKNSIGLLDQATEAYLASRTTTMPLLDSILAEDPDMPMALCFRGYLLKLAADPKFRPVQQRVLSQLDGLRPAMNDREILHLSALEALINNQMTRSVE
ncbi:MAG: hypothetical protein KDI36_20425, partial [Pseudomonadales bacterium]|nr:hypothetical protein [Pseudomonadales bacterium]